jgi:hypothetical protein
VAALRSRQRAAVRFALEAGFAGRRKARASGLFFED